MDPLYFIAINTPDNVTDRVREQQKILADNFESSRQLRIPVHITLIPPFRMGSESMKNILDSLRSFVAGRSRFEIDLDGFGEFKQRTIFIHVEDNPHLTMLLSELHYWLETNCDFVPPIKHPVFRPHVTVANRDLKPEMFIQAWRLFKEKNFSMSFEVTEIHVLKHDGKLWQLIDTIPIG